MLPLVKKWFPWRRREKVALNYRKIGLMCLLIISASPTFSSRVSQKLSRSKIGVVSGMALVEWLVLQAAWKKHSSVMTPIITKLCAQQKYYSSFPCWALLRCGVQAKRYQNGFQYVLSGSPLWHSGYISNHLGWAIDKTMTVCFAASLSLSVCWWLSKHAQVTPNQKTFLGYRWMAKRVWNKHWKTPTCLIPATWSWCPQQSLEQHNLGCEEDPLHKSMQASHDKIWPPMFLDPCSMLAQDNLGYWIVTLWNRPVSIQANKSVADTLCAPLRACSLTWGRPLPSAATRCTQSKVGKDMLDVAIQWVKKL